MQTPSLEPRAPSRRRAIAATLLFACIGSAAAQAPSGPVRIVVGFPAGGTIDAVSRDLAEQLRKELGVTVVVENVTGAGGQLAAQALKRAAPDGRTLMVAPDHTMVTVPLTVKAPGFDPVADFTAVGLVARYAGALAVGSATGVSDLKGFFALAKSQPEKAAVGVPSSGSLPQFALGSLAKSQNLQLNTVPYRGSAPLVQDLLGGHVAAAFTAAGDFLEHEAGGKLRVIGVGSAKRLPQLPNVPTFVESGYPLQLEFWIGLFAPAQTPEPVRDRLNAALAKALAQPEVRSRMTKLLFEPAAGAPRQLSEIVRRDIEQLSPQVAASGWVKQ